MRCVVLLLVASLVTVSQAQVTGYQNNFGGANYAGLAAYTGYGGQNYGYAGQGYGYGGQGYGGHGFSGFFPGNIAFGIPVQYGHHVIQPTKVQLNATRNSTVSGSEETLSVVIREKMSRQSYNPYQFFGGFNGHSSYGQHDDDLGLEMEISIMSDSVASGTKVFIAITEFDGFNDLTNCSAELSGTVITPGQNDKHHGGFPIDAAFAAHSLGSGYGGSASASQSAIAMNDAVVAEITLMPNQVTKINVNSLNSITKLSELAGRGVIACTKLELNYQGRLVCTGTILSCAGLTYAKRVMTTYMH